MNRFPVRLRLPVARPYRLDLTAQALRRLAANAVDVLAPDGAYHRALRLGNDLAALRVTQVEPDALEIEATGGDPELVRAAVVRMLGVDADLREWPRRASRVAWLAPIAHALRGVHPPRYPTLWEACAHAIVFQQISIHAAGAIMLRLVEAFGERARAGEVELVAFPEPEALLRASEERLGAVGLSANKRAHLRAAAAAVLDGTVREDAVDALASPEAIAYLTRVRGIGPWSAAVVLLRGFGRLDVFPMRDSGVARSVRELAGDVTVDLDGVLETLGPVKGLLYFHLLLGRLRNLGPRATD